MNTNQLKKFAQAARKKLKEQVSARLELVLKTDSAELREQAAQIEILRQELRKSSREQVVDRVAYTWFNRLVALRFMDANDYQPLDIRILSPREGSMHPEILNEAKQGHIPETLKVDHKRVNDLLDGKIPSQKPENEVYRHLLVAACNYLHSILPFLFERIDDYTELLLPDDLTTEFSIVHDIREGMQEEDCREVEIIGWLYQFYISEKKDEVFASKSKVKKEDIPAATQLFTPRWIVEYMVQNTLGKLWLQNRPNSALREHMPYFIESASLKAEDYLKVESVEEIKLLDQACGSGHILVYAFELLSKIYEEEGYSTNEIPHLIIENNLFGFEIDNRAAQLAGMALMMKARGYQRRFFRKVANSNIHCFRDLMLNTPDLDNTIVDFGLPLIGSEHWHDIKFSLGDSSFNKILNECGIIINQKSIDKLSKKDLHKIEQEDKLPYFFLEDLKEMNPTLLDRIQKQLKSLNITFEIERLNHIQKTEQQIAEEYPHFLSSLYKDILLLQQATNFGSLIAPSTNLDNLKVNLDTLNEQQEDVDLFEKQRLEQLIEAIKQLILLSQKYHCVVDNPPYMGGGNMNKTLSDFVKKNYPDSKADLMGCFMESGLAMLQEKGFLGMINQHSWMFLSSYEGLRKKLIENIFVDNLLHLGPRTFPEIGGEVVQNASFIFWNKKTREKGSYIRLVDFERSDLKKQKTLEAILNPQCGWFHTADQFDFEKIPGSPIAYWVTHKVPKLFEEIDSLGDFVTLKSGMSTTNNERFLRLWSELAFKSISINSRNKDEARLSDCKWFPYNKGGAFKKWYGNNDYVVNWKNDGEEIKIAVVNNPSDPNTTHWSRRIYGVDYFFESCVTWTRISSSNFSCRISPQGSIISDASNGIFSEESDKLNISLALLNSNVSKYLLEFLSPTLNFHSGEIKNIPFNESLKKRIQLSIICDSINIAKIDWNLRETSWDFQQNELLRHQGQDLEESYDLYCQYWKNKFFELHRNEEELNRQFIEIYGLQEELTPEVPLKEITILQDETEIVNGLLQFKSREVFAQFLSYAVGCMFGRYSLEKEGLILANQGETLQEYLEKVGKSKSEISFLPDEDNIIPILDDEWFEDDIVGRFYEFLKVTFGEENYSKNLAFVEECLGKSVRKYFVKDFYNDHIRRYKKRPIYWMFSSPQGSFNVLIYMHRYTPDTLNEILNKYLREFQQKLRARKEHLRQIEISGSASEKAKAIKEIDNIDKVLLELQTYERDILYPLATERISIDLDDGVLVNYNKFGKAIKEVKGLNDTTTKQKVKDFDWINTTQIK